jgi:hypothetical protein
LSDADGAAFCCNLAYAPVQARNDYLYVFLLMSSVSTTTMPVALGKIPNSNETVWNSLQVAAIIYVLPPLAFNDVFRRRMSTVLNPRWLIQVNASRVAVQYRINPWTIKFLTFRMCGRGRTTNICG